MLIINKKLFIVKHISFIISANVYTKKAAAFAVAFQSSGYLLPAISIKKTTFSQDSSLLQTERC